MGYPKKKSNFVLNPPKIGSEYLKYGLDRIETLMLKTDKKTTFLPRSIDFRTIDQAIVDFVKSKDMKITIEGKDVPVIFLTSERWSEFAKTWQYVDLDKNLLTPFITITRTGEADGTRLGTKWAIPQRKRHAYVDVPIFEDGEVINLRFKIPEPTNVDFTYEIKFFTKFQKHANVFDEKKYFTFGSRQSFIWAKGSPMPLVKEADAGNTSIQDPNGDRLYIKTISIRVLGYIQDEKDFQIVKTTRMPKITYNIEG